MGICTRRLGSKYLGSIRQLGDDRGAVVLENSDCI
jgi:hypothetical protein